MNILVVSNMYPSDKDKLYGTFVRNFVEGLSELDSDGSLSLVVIRGRRRSMLAKIAAYVKFYSDLTSRLLFCRYDLVYIHTITFPILPVLFASIFRRLPLVFNVHGDDVLPATRLKKMLKRLAAGILPEARMVVAPSDYFKDVVLREFPELSGDRLFVSPSGGVNDRFFVKKKSGFSGTCPVRLGYVSRIDEGKGWDTFLRAVSILTKRDVECSGVMAGRGAQTAALHEMIDRLGIDDRVTYLGGVEQHALPDLYSSFDLLVFPTGREAESLGLVGIEAMAAGTPVIAGNVGGPASYIAEGENGYLFSPGDSDELVERIESYIRLTPSEKSAMSDAAKATASGYRSGIVHLQMYEKLKSLIPPSE